MKTKGFTAARRFRIWALSVLVGATTGASGGAVLGLLLAKISYDYVVRPSDYMHTGLRLGLLAGTVVAACQVAGHVKPSADATTGLLAVCLALVITALGIGLGASLGYTALQLGLLDSSGWALPNPTRHALLLGVDRSLHPSGAVGIAVAAAWVLVNRWRCA